MTEPDKPAATPTAASMSLSNLSSRTIERIFHYLCRPSSEERTRLSNAESPNFRDVFNLAQTSQRMLSIFSKLYLSFIDARLAPLSPTPANLVPILESTIPTSKSQSALHIARLIYLSGENLQSLRLASFMTESSQNTLRVFRALSSTNSALRELSFFDTSAVLELTFPQSLHTLAIHRPSLRTFERLLDQSNCNLVDVTLTGLSPQVLPDLKKFLKRIAPNIVSLSLAFDTGITEPPLEHVTDIRNMIGPDMQNLRSLVFLTSERYFLPHRHFQDEEVNVLEDTLMFLQFAVDDLRSASCSHALRYLCVDTSLDSIATNVMPFNILCDARTRVQVEILNGTLIFPISSRKEFPYFQAVRNLDRNLSIALLGHPFAPLRNVEDITIGEKSVQALINMADDNYDTADECEHAPNAECLPVITGQMNGIVTKLRIRFDVCTVRIAHYFLVYLQNVIRDVKDLELLELPFQWVASMRTEYAEWLVVFRDLKYLKRLVLTERSCEVGHKICRMSFLGGLTALIDILKDECPQLDTVCGQKRKWRPFFRPEEHSSLIRARDMIVLFSAMRPNVDIGSIEQQVLEWINALESIPGKSEPRALPLASQS